MLQSLSSPGNSWNERSEPGQSRKAAALRNQPHARSPSPVFLSQYALSQNFVRGIMSITSYTKFAGYCVPFVGSFFAAHDMKKRKYLLRNQEVSREQALQYEKETRDYNIGVLTGHALTVAIAIGAYANGILGGLNAALWVSISDACLIQYSLRSFYY